MLAEPSFKSASAKGQARDSGPWDVHAEGVKGEETDVARCDHMRWDGVPRSAHRHGSAQRDRP